MIDIGRIQELPILRRTNEELVVGDELSELHLPASADPSGKAAVLKVFVNTGRNGELLASAKMPKAQVGEFATMRVSAIRGAGAHVDWGLDPALLVPHEEQKKDMEQGRYYVVRVYLDDETQRIQGSTRVERFLDNEQLTVQAGDKVELVVYMRSDLGLSVVVNGRHHGLVHANEVFKPVSLGDRITGYVKTVRPDNKLDITLQAIGYRQYIDAHTAMVAKRIQEKNGFLPLSDKSSAEEIYAEFGISKKSFKKALGALYKDRLIRIGDEGVVWVG